MRAYRVGFTEQSRGAFRPQIVATEEDGTEHWLPGGYATVKDAEVVIGELEERDAPDPDFAATEVVLP